MKVVSIFYIVYFIFVNYPTLTVNRILPSPGKLGSHIILLVLLADNIDNPETKSKPTITNPPTTCRILRNQTHLFSHNTDGK